MAGRKANKPKKALKKPDLTKLKPAEVLCPVCRTIFIEPVTLPCDHVFCKQCFEGTMENANLVCPVCRHRVGSWYRKSKKENKLVDQEFWKAIQEQYSLEVANKHQGIDNDMEEEKPIIIVAPPGEIRKEYEKERQRDMEEQKKIREAEEKASADLIKKINEEEEYKRQVEEEKLRLDALLAKKLADELNMPSTSKTKTESAKKCGPMDRFVTTEDRANRKIHQKKQELNKGHSLLKLSRKSLLLNPSHSKNHLDKAYSCHVLPVEQSPIRVNRTSSLFADLDFKRVFGTQGQKAAKTTEPDRRKSRCTSGYKSSGSGDNSDVIDQECKFYFKPIDTQRRHHVPAKVPLTVQPLLGINDGSVPIEAPSGKILILGSVISAFVNFKTNCQAGRRASSCNQIEAETPTSTKNLKRKSRTEGGSPDRKKVKRQLFVAKKKLLKMESKSASSPFFGFDNKSGTVVNTPSFHGFDSTQIEESERNTNTLNWVVSHYGASAKKDYLHMTLPDESFDISFHQNKKRIDRHSLAIPQKLTIPKHANSAVRSAKVIANKLAELKDGINRRKTSAIDINRNIPKTNRHGTNLNANSRSAKILAALGQNRVTSNAVAVSITCPKVSEANTDFVNKEEPVEVNNSQNSSKIADTGVTEVNGISTPNRTPQNDDGSAVNGNNVHTNSDVKYRKTPLPPSSLLINSEHISSKVELSMETPPGIFDSDSEDEVLSKLINKICNNTGSVDNYPEKASTIHTVNGIPDTNSPEKNKKISPRKLKTSPKKTLIQEDRLETVNNCAEVVKSDIVKKVTKTSWLSKKHRINNILATKMRSNQTKAKKVKLSPKKYPTRNNINPDDDYRQLNGDTDVDKKRIQEEADLALAKKLQAEFDLIRVASTTRRGTKRQITLDNMLSV